MTTTPSDDELIEYGAKFRCTERACYNAGLAAGRAEQEAYGAQLIRALGERMDQAVGTLQAEKLAAEQKLAALVEGLRALRERTTLPGHRQAIDDLLRSTGNGP